MVGAWVGGIQGTDGRRPVDSDKGVDVIAQGQLDINLFAIERTADR